MKKMLAAFDGLKFSTGTRDYAISLAKENDGHLVGLFLEDLAYHSYRIYDLVTEEGGGLDTRRKRLDKKDSKIRATAVANFENSCKKAGIAYSIHKDRNIAIQELLRESIYADLIIIDGNETLSHHPENLPTTFIRHLLQDVQCPVLIVPNKYKPVDQLILLFDGEPSSVHAIKMMSYTLPSLITLPVEVVTVRTSDQEIHLPDNKLMTEFMKRHFPSATYTPLKGLAETEILKYLKKQKGHPMVVLGAYRRGKVSRWFRASMADILMKEVNFPFFIAHNK
jgi:hypothetical protein